MVKNKTRGNTHTKRNDIFYLIMLNSVIRDAWTSDIIYYLKRNKKKDKEICSDQELINNFSLTHMSYFTCYQFCFCLVSKRQREKNTANKKIVFESRKFTFVQFIKIHSNVISFATKSSSHLSVDFFFTLFLYTIIIMCKNNHSRKNY